MARVHMLPGRRSAGSRSLKAFAAAARRLRRWRFCDGPSAVMRQTKRGWGTHAIVSMVPRTLSSGHAAASPLVAGCMRNASYFA
eukprot:365093-Chlamydomonas_euryale.AAC.10